MRRHVLHVLSSSEAQSSKMSDKTVAPFACESFVYACKVEETTNGCRRGTRGQARKEVEVITQRRLSPDGELDE
jgi:hypothetical protein